MNSTLYKMLNPTATLEQSLPAIIEAFVLFYGEENRSYIEEKFSNTIMIGYGVPDKLPSILSKANKNITEELIENFFNKALINQNRNELKNILFGPWSYINFSYMSLFPFQRYIDYIEMEDKENIDSYAQKEVLKFLQSINSNITLENMDEVIEKGTFEEIDKLIPLYKEMIQSYFIKKKKIEYLEQINDKQKNLKQNIKTKYWLKLLDEFTYLFSPQEINLINEELEKYGAIGYRHKLIYSYLGHYLFDTPLLYAFNEEAEELLVNGSKWKKDSIISDRIEFFKNSGIDLGNDYELYKNNEQCQKLIPSVQIIEKIKNRRKELHAMMLDQYYKETDEYKINREKINKNNLLDKDDGYDVSAYAHHITFISPNIAYKDDKYLLTPLMCINIDAADEARLDANIIHELNHVFELNLVNVDGMSCEFVCGWDIIESNFGKTPEEVKSLEPRIEKRKYELFNEIINELISQEITTILHNSNNYIFNSKDNAKIKGGTSYEDTFFLIKKFYETYKKEILESRKTGNMQSLFDVVGKENFDALNNLFHVFYDNFSGMKIYAVLNNLNSGIENEDTLKYLKLAQESDSIFEKMQEYSLENGKNRNQL